MRINKLRYTALLLALDLNVRKVRYRPKSVLRRPKGSLKMREHFKGLGNNLFL